jgi:Asp-tRNA(Asn)/Glu-tRNA(Gln) amidotransferase A subunit family amidase
MFEQAYARAASLDEHFRNTGTLLGPLHGLPISIKDMLFIRDVHTTLGLTSHLSHPPDARHSALVAALEHLGAIVPYVKTNVPQLLLSFECNNVVWGRTTNPYNASYTSGGSSGGEAALIAFRGSAFGIGTDIGGSLRIPAGYCGIYSLKPCSRKGSTWPTEGMASLGGGFEGLIGVAGPMARSAEDLEMAWVEMGKVFSLEGMKADPVEYTLHKEALEKEFGVPDLPAMKPTDYASLRPLALSSARGKPLRIGFYLTDGFVHTTPAVYRAMDETLAALRKRYTEEEIELVPLMKEDVRAVEAMEIFVGLTSAAKYRHLTHPHLAPDKLDPTLWVPVYVSRLPAPVRALIGFILRYVLGERDFAKLGAAAGGKSSEEYFKWVKRREDFKKEWRERVWEGYGLDAIIA